MSVSRVVLPVFVAVVASFVPAIATAATARIDYNAEEGCPDEGAFVERVKARVSTFEGSAATATVDWLVSAGRVVAGVTTGQLVVREGGKNSTREVQGETCSEVVSALALVAALTVEPEGAAPSESAPVSTESAERPNARSRSAQMEGGLQFGGGASSELEGGVLPEVTFAIAPFVEVRTRRAGVFAPAIRVGLSRSFSADMTITSRGSASFVLTAGWLDLCPSRWAGGPFSVTACARAEAGVLHGEGRNITPAREEGPPWLAAGGVVRGAVVVAGPLAIEASGGVRVPLLRSRYIFQTDTTVFRVPAIGWIAAVGVALHFP